MAEKSEKKSEEKPAAAAAAAPAGGSGDHGDAKKAKGGGLLKSLPMLLGIVMVLEAVVLFAGFKFLGSGPKSAQGAELTAEGHGGEATGKEGEHGVQGGSAPKEKKKVVEVQIVQDKFPNTKNGHMFLYDVSIFAVTKGDNEEKLTSATKERGATIRDHIRTIIAQSDPEKLGGGSEPGLETLRRQVKYQLDEIVGEGMIEEVLIPRCVPFRADF